MTDRPETVTAVATHRFARARAEEVYDAWLDPADVRGWMALALGAMGQAADIREVEIDARIGGRFLFTDMRAGEEARHWGRYSALDRPRLIEFTWFTSEEEEAEGLSLVRVEIAARDTGCEVTVTHVMSVEWAAYLAQTARGWVRMMEGIERRLT